MANNPPFDKAKSDDFESKIKDSHGCRHSAYTPRYDHDWIGINRFSDRMSFNYLARATWGSWYLAEGKLRMWNPYKLVDAKKRNVKFDNKSEFYAQQRRINTEAAMETSILNTNPGDQGKKNKFMSAWVADGDKNVTDAEGKRVVSGMRNAHLVRSHITAQKTLVLHIGVLLRTVPADIQELQAV